MILGAGPPPCNVLAAAVAVVAVDALVGACPSLFGRAVMPVDTAPDIGAATGFAAAEFTAAGVVASAGAASVGWIAIADPPVASATDA